MKQPSQKHIPSVVTSQLEWRSYVEGSFLRVKEGWWADCGGDGQGYHDKDRTADAYIGLYEEGS